MKKVVIEKPGGYRCLQIREIATPEPGAGEVLVEITGAGVNFADVVIRMGLYKSARQYVGWPITPGFDFAGRVVKCGAGVAALAAGSPVFGVTRFGAYATHVCVPRHQVFPIAKDSKFSLDQWAAFPTAFLTAYFALFQNFVLRPGMQMLVHSAAGGVGGALVQLGRIAGCRMTAVVGAGHKVPAARALGAEAVIDKGSENLWARAEQICPQGFDVVFDGNGPSTLKQSYRHLKPTGKLVTYGFHSMFSKRGGFPNYFKLAVQYFKIPRWNPLNLTNDNKSLMAFNLSYLFERRELLAEAIQDLVKWVEAGRIKAPTVQRFALENVADAHRALESGQTVGKLILKMAD